MNSNRSRLEALIYNLLLKSGPLDAHTISLIVEAEEKTVKNVLKELVSNRVIMRIKDTDRYVALPKLFPTISDIDGMLDHLDKLGKTVGEETDKFIRKMELGYGDLLTMVKNSLTSLSSKITDDASNIVTLLEGSLRNKLMEIRGLIAKTDEALSSLDDIAKRLDQTREKIRSPILEVLDKSKDKMLGEIDGLANNIHNIFTKVAEPMTALFLDSRKKVDRDLPKQSSFWLGVFLPPILFATGFK